MFALPIVSTLNDRRGAKSTYRSVNNPVNPQAMIFRTLPSAASVPRSKALRLPLTRPVQRPKTRVDPNLRFEIARHNAGKMSAPRTSGSLVLPREELMQIRDRAIIL
ncbi:hypothetical protein SAMN05444166_7012 [Singulisphaera sp. GP187]|nr:hypothetical protein SAMN05444166_7012 [Singulisphaera sp. GP187]